MELEDFGALPSGFGSSFAVRRLSVLIGENGHRLSILTGENGCRLSVHGWRNQGGGGREGPSPPGPINFTSWVGPGGPIYTENGPFLLLSDCFQQLQ